MQVLELPQATHPYFVGTQFHPELTSRPLSPQPLFMGLFAAAIAETGGETELSPAVRRWLRPVTASSGGPRG